MKGTESCNTTLFFHSFAFQSIFSLMAQADSLNILLNDFQMTSLTILCLGVIFYVVAHTNNASILFNF